MSIVPCSRKTSYFHDPFALDPSDPFQQFHHQGAPCSPPVPSRPHCAAETAASPFTTTRIEWTQTPTAHVLKLNLPGVKREEVMIDLEDERVLKITGEKCFEKEDRSDGWHRMERSKGQFMTSVMLPENCKPHETEACMENGVLTIKVPKREVWNGCGKSTRIAIR